MSTPIMIDLKELDYKSLGARWRLVILAAFLLLVPIWIAVIWLGEFEALNNADDRLKDIDEAVVIAAEIIAFIVVLRMSRKMEGTKFGSGIGLLALGLFFLAANEILWWLATMFENQRLSTQYNNNALLVPDAAIYWALVASEHFFTLLQGIFVVLAAFALRDIFEAAQRLQIEIDREKTKREVSKVFESDYFERIRSEGIKLRRNRENK
jgi:hypothetical protein